LKFDIPGSIEKTQIQSAILHLSSSGHTGGSSVVVNINCHALNAFFDESAVTWNSLSGGDYDASVFSSGALPTGNAWTTTIDITNLLAENLNKVRDNGILLKLAKEGPDKLYHNIASRECDDISNPDYVEADEPPSLEIIYSAPSSTTTAIQTSSTSSTTTTIAVTTTSSTSTTTTTALCPVLQMFKDEKSREVQVIRKFRNRRMTKSFTGVMLIYAYYANSEEITNILSANAELENTTAKLLSELSSAIELSLKHNTAITLTPAQYDESIKVLMRIHDAGSPQLQKTTGYILKQLESGDIFRILRIRIDEN
jgi:hypothetical protein